MTPRSTALVAAALLILTAAPAFASSTKTWVSSTGTDTGACPLTAPCKTFQYAHDQTTAGGEIDVKDSGSYGQVIITKAISIVNGEGAVAAVGVPSGGVGITVNAGPSDHVVLQGLVVDGHSVGKNGIEYFGASSLVVEDCRVRNLTTDGVLISTAGSASYSISHSEIANARFAGVQTSAAGTVSGSNLHDNNIGVIVSGGSTVVSLSTIQSNATGLRSDGGFLAVGQSVVAANSQYGIYDASGNAYTYGDNDIDYNGTNVSGALSSIPKK